MKEYKASQEWKREGDMPVLFLAGSIEQGTAEAWQDKVVEAIKNYPVIVLNPRRSDWDASWDQSINNKEFVRQVTWEVNGLLKADIVAFYFDKNTKSPITLYELGLLSMKVDTDVFVCCPEGYWRKGNVDIYGNLFGFYVADNLNKMIKKIKYIL